ncbi:peptidoglycan DD-metalloendopeptidase family protein [Salinibacterium amurskyense]|uniref:M23 family metallopeptidase n=1 Tax=Salinibacterium amurskyense TaxID=205941 RepID=UPI00311E4414
MSRDTQFPQHPGTGENPPLTRKEMRERERRAQQDGRKKSSSKHPVEAPTAPVLADLFTSHSSPSSSNPEHEIAEAVAVEVAPTVIPAQVVETAVVEAAVVERAVVEPAVVASSSAVTAAALPSRRSMRNKQAAVEAPTIPVAATPAPASVVPPAPGAPTVSERLFTAPIATVSVPTAESAPDTVPATAPTSIRADEPLDLLGITPTTLVASSYDAAAAATTEAPVATPASRKRSKPGKAAKAARAPKQAAAATAPRSRKKSGSTVKSKRVWVSRKALAPSSSSGSSGKRSASKALSLVAMLFAFPILVGVSVPSNVFMNADSAVIAAGAPAADVAALSATPRTTQSLAVSDDVESEVAAHDNIKVISYAEVLALKYAGVSYEYNATTGAVRWPFPYSVPITDGYGDRIGGFHKGTDFAAASGTPIYAIADGTVELIQADWSGYGYHAVISHTINGQQVTSLYAHMITDSSPIVVGQEIKAGDFLGLVGETGIAYGAHLHFEIHLDDVPVDPYAWLTANAVN